MMVNISRQVENFWNHHSTDAKLFLTFILAASVFMQWGGYNDSSRLFLSESIVEEGDLDISENWNKTGDRVFYQGEYYSDKPPVSSLLGVPAYIAADGLFSSSSPSQDYIAFGTDLNGNDVYAPVNPSKKKVFSQIFFVFLTAVLPGGLTVILLRKILSNYYDLIISQIVSAMFGFGTLIFHYSHMANGAMLGTLFTVASLYFYTSEVDHGRILSGICLGLAFSTAFYTLYILISFYCLFWFKEEFSDILRLSSGVFIGFLPLLMYIYFISTFDTTFISNLFLTTFSSRVPATELSTGMEVVRTPLRVLLDALTTAPKLLFYPSGGLLFYSPFLIVSLFVIRKKKNMKWQEWWPLLILFLGVLFNSLFVFWWAGSSFSTRYLLPVIPFLSLPLASVIENSKKSKRLIYFLFPLSALNMLAGTNGGISQWGGELASRYSISGGHILTSPRYSDTIIDIELLIENLTPYSLGNYFQHLKWLWKDGPGGRLITSSLSEGVINIHYFADKHITTFLEIAGFELTTRWIPLTLVLAISFVIWRNEILNCLGLKLSNT